MLKVLGPRGKKKKGIILCATMRCGSTMVSEDFWNTESLGRPEEYFIPWMVSPDKVDYPNSFRNIIRRSRSENKFSTIKIMANQIESINKGLASFVDMDEVEGDPLFHVFQDYHFVYIKRNNVFKQAVSRFIAQHRMSFHMKEDKGLYTPGGVITPEELEKEDKKFPFNPQRIAVLASSIIAENMQWEATLKAHNIDYITIQYEDIVASGNTAYLNDICKKFGLPKVEEVIEKRTLKKMSNQANRDLYDKFYNLAVRQFKK